MNLFSRLSAILRIGRASVKIQQGRPSAAIAILEKVLLVQPENPVALNLMGVACMLTGLSDKGVAFLEKACLHSSYDPETMANLGRARVSAGRPLDAIRVYDALQAKSPLTAEILADRGIALAAAGRSDEALASYDLALEKNDKLASAWLNKGKLLHDLQRYTEALAMFDNAITISSGASSAWSNRGATLSELKQHEAAIDSYDRALELEPGNAWTWTNRGVSLHALDRNEEALQNYAAALRIDRKFIPALRNRAVLLYRTQQYTASLECLREILDAEPELAEVRVGEGFALLIRGDMERGWEAYESRWDGTLYQDGTRAGMPQWTGQESLQGKSLLLWAEQGCGDTIQFCRFAKLFKQFQCTVILEVQPELKSLIGTLGDCKVIGRDEPLIRCDFQLPMMSVPRVLKTRVDSIPRFDSYLYADNQKRLRWAPRLASNGRLKIGIACSGNIAYTLERYRSFSLAKFLPLARFGKLFLLQKTLSASDSDFLRTCSEITHIGKDLDDFDDTAAIIAQCDLVISIDTSIVHIAGALGKPIWILLSTVSDWRWLEDRSDSPWYPDARLFRQKHVNDWDSVIREVAMELGAFTTVPMKELEYPVAEQTEIAATRTNEIFSIQQ